MIETRQFIVLITGVREQAPLGPSVVDIDEMVSVLQHAKDLLFPEPKDRPRVSVKIEEGSVKIILLTAAAAVIQTQALLAEVNRTKNLDILSPRQVTAILQFQKFSRDNHFNISFGERDRLDEGLTITPATEWKQAKPVWVGAELYISGKITNLGGKTNPNIHLETADFDLGTLIISAPEHKLAQDDRNRLYKNQQVHIRIKQNLDTGVFDPKSAELISFIDMDEQEESVEDYLNRLVKEASPNWEKVKDKEAWLREIRGYGD